MGNTQSNTVSSPTGMIWKRSGTTPTTTSSELPQKSAQPFSPKLHSTQKLTQIMFETFTLQPCTSPSRPSSPSTPPVEPPVSFWTLVMESPTTSQSTKVMLSHTLSCDSILPVET